MRGLVDRLTWQDQRLMTALAGREAPRLVDRGFRLVTHAGGATATVAVSGALLLLPATRHLGLLAAMANLFSHLTVQALKRVVVRSRPSVRLPHVLPLADLPDHFSFPSGHACSAMAVAVAVLLVEPVAGIPAVLFALAVGASRVYLRVHYVTDVVVGQLVGAVTAVLVAQSLS